MTAYDAVYVALAEVLSAALLTRDKRLANASGHEARVELV
jgi:predicted nucleic acid-binding protein